MAFGGQAQAYVAASALPIFNVTVHQENARRWAWEELVRRYGGDEITVTKPNGEVESRSTSLTEFEAVRASPDDGTCTSI